MSQFKNDISEKKKIIVEYSDRTEINFALVSLSRKEIETQFFK